MLWMTRYDKHADLVNRMAETLGVDLAEEMLKGNLPPQEIRSTVMACMGCGEPGACAEWLEAHPEGSEAAPHYCRNKDRFEALASL
jgi:pyrroloquinoline quinone (PQQ) biosynthesis protein C